MMKKIISGGFALAAFVACAAVGQQDAKAKTTFEIVHAFAGKHEPAVPNGELIADASGNLYGTTKQGGTCCGTIFRIAPGGTETVLHRFKGGRDGNDPEGGLLADGAGNFYGTTALGGGKCNCGTIYKLASDGKKTVLHFFQGTDGDSPIGSLVADHAGNVYGVTRYGGGLPCPPACGTMFKLAPDNTLTVVVAFKGFADGSSPSSGLIIDAAGNLYGTTEYGGNNNCGLGCGTIYKVAPNGTETVLHVFTGSDGYNPVNDPLVMDADGNLFGMVAGGDSRKGIVYRFSQDGALTTLHEFTGGKDGANPESGLTLDESGNLYGTTFSGGGTGCNGSGCGTAFKISTTGQETLLHRFKASDGYAVESTLLRGNDGRLYGTTRLGPGAHGQGVVFEITP